MKITNLKCPSCGGKLIPMEKNPKIVVCEFCNSEFMLEEDQAINYHIHQYSGGPVNTGVPTGAGSPVNIGSSNNSKSKGDSPTPTIITAGLMVAFLVVVIGAGIFVGGARPGDSGKKSATVAASGEKSEYGADASLAEEEQGSETARAQVSPLYEAIAEGIFGKDLDRITEEDLSKVTYLKITTGQESAKAEYSFQDPFEDGFQAETLTLEPLEWSGDSLGFFTGLQKVEMAYARDMGSLEGLTGLRGLVCSGLDIAQVEEMVPSPEQVVELGFKGLESLEGIGAFPNLERLTLEDMESPDLKQLVPLKKLTDLTIVEDVPYDPFAGSDAPKTLTDYSALSVLTSLESLSIESSALREFSFLKSLTGLTSLSLADTEAISVEPLGELAQLVSLSLVDNSSVKDYSPISRLTGLTSLTIDKGTDQDDPDLSSLTNLEKLDMSGFMSVSFLGNMNNLKELVLHGCNIDEISALSGLTGLERLTCYSVWTYAVPLKNVNFINGMTNLKFLDFSGISQGSGWGGYQRNTEIYGDISDVFNHGGLEELYLNNCMFELNFGNLQENPSLRVLQMREVNLKENIVVQSSGGMTDIWYDDVALDEHTDFLTKYPNLEELYLDGNQLTNIGFAASLKNLTHLGINNNYVTELSPLNQAESLKYLDIRSNPIGSTIETDGKVQILK